MADELANQINKLTIQSDKAISPTGGHASTGLVYDEFMTKHVFIHPHPECPERILRIHEALTTSGVVERCTPVKSREATNEELLTVHTEEHIQNMLKTASMPADELNLASYTYNSIYLNEFSYKCALLSAGSVVELTHQVVKGHLTNGIAIVRPPGHHAVPDKAMGFCLFNNVAIAAHLAKHKWGVKKIVILDWDVHHGNGTQNMFEQDPSVLYISFHRYMNGCFYPSSIEGRYDQIGTGEGAGYNVNVSWDHFDVTDGDVMAVFHFVILPIISEFGPDLIIVSSGFDAAVGDPLGNCQLTPELFGNMTHLLKTYANGKIVLALEGGYNLTSISQAAVECSKALLGDATPALPPLKPCHAAVKAIINTIDAHVPYWECLKLFKNAFTSTISTPAKSNSTPNKNVNSKIEAHSATTTPTSTTTDNNRPTTRSATRDRRSNESNFATTYIDSNADCRLDSITAAASAQGEETLTMFAVQPLPTCPHVAEIPILSEELSIDSKAQCEVCQHTPENWVCFVCFKVLCSRYVNSHMVDHYNNEHHCLTLSFSDLSIWCYGCDNYINSGNPRLKPYVDILHRDKFSH